MVKCCGPGAVPVPVPKFQLSIKQICTLQYTIENYVTGTGNSLKDKLTQNIIFYDQYR